MPITIDRCHGSQALAEFANLRADAISRGHSTVLVGGPHEWARLTESMTHQPPDVARTIRDATGLSVPQWLAGTLINSPYWYFWWD